MTELDRALAEGLARELRAVYDHVSVYEPARWLARSGKLEPQDCRRMVVWHHGAAGVCTLALVAVHTEGLVLHLGPRHSHGWARVESIPYADPEAVTRILDGLATVVI